MLKAIRNALRRKDNSKIEADESSKINKPKYWEKWTDPLVIVTIILAFATFALYWDATNQTGIATDAAKAADRSAVQAKRANDIAEKNIKSSDSANKAFLDKADKSANAATNSANALLAWEHTGEDNYKLSKLNFDSSISANKISIIIAHQTLQTQIDAFEKAQKNFQIQNEPFLQITNPTYDSPGVSKKFGVTFEIQNLGNYPAKIIGAKLSIFGCDNPPNSNTIPYRVEDTLYLINSYVIKESPLKKEIYCDSVFFIQRNDSLLKTGTIKTYFWGYIQYINLVTYQPRIYCFKIVIESKPGEKGRFVWNENKNVPPKDSARIYPLGAWDDPMFSNAFK